MRIHRLGVADGPQVLAASDRFDHPPTMRWTADFLQREGHHLLICDDGREADDEIAVATYRSAGAEPPESAATLWWDLT